MGTGGIDCNIFVTFDWYTEIMMQDSVYIGIETAPPPQRDTEKTQEAISRLTKIIEESNRIQEEYDRWRATNILRPEQSSEC